MNIAVISEHASPLATLGGVDSGGQNVYVAHVARELGRAGHRVEVLTRRDDPRPAAVVPFAPNVAVVHVDAGPPRFIPKESLLPYMDSFARAVERRTAARHYDLVHANFFMSGWVAMRLKQRLGLPFVMTFHALGKVRQLHHPSGDSFPSARVAIEQDLVECADRVIAECPQDFDDLVALYGACPDRIDIVPCGYDPGELGPAGRSARAELGIGAHEFVVLQLGRLVPRKGIDNVVRALACLHRERGVQARLVVVGGEADRPDPAATPEIGRLQALAAQEGVERQVLFTGRRPRERLRDYYCAANVFVTTPWYEPFGITPVEAMACGVPVIGAQVGGIKDTVVDGVTGFLVPPQDPGALAERLARFYRNPELARAFGRAGLRRVRAAYTWRRITGGIAAVYERALATTPASIGPLAAAAR